MKDSNLISTTHYSLDPPCSIRFLDMESCGLGLNKSVKADKVISIYFKRYEKETVVYLSKMDKVTSVNLE